MSILVTVLLCILSEQPAILQDLQIFRCGHCLPIALVMVETSGEETALVDKLRTISHIPSSSPPLGMIPVCHVSYDPGIP